MVRNAGLDGLRAVAIMAVVVFHTWPWLRGGFFGVDVFFTLSGYLITTLLLREHSRRGQIDLPRFYLRRALRLLPALFALLAACVLYESLVRPFDGGPSIWVRSLYALSNASNWIWATTAPADWLGPLNAVWSLAIEEQFYFVWPVLLCVLLRRRVPPGPSHSGWRAPSRRPSSGDCIWPTRERPSGACTPGQTRMRTRY